jgi:UDPglucose 6-dehydrogenase
MTPVKINKINKKKYKGYVYNLELESDSDKDDLFWIEQDTGIVTHNCFPKDINAMIAVMEEQGIDPKILKAVWEQNLAVREDWDWERIKGAVKDD